MCDPSKGEWPHHRTCPECRDAEVTTHGLCAACDDRLRDLDSLDAMIDTYDDDLVLFCGVHGSPLTRAGHCMTCVDEMSADHGVMVVSL